MSVYLYLKTHAGGASAHAVLSRPEAKNALNPEAIRELYDFFDSLPTEVRTVVLEGEGDNFCAGIDLDWLRKGISNSEEDNITESLELIDLFAKIRKCPVPVITLAKGTTLGAGIGIMLSSDIIIAEEGSKFGLSEVAIGVVPAAIIKEVTERAGVTKSRELLLTGRRIDAAEALSCGLINYVADKTAVPEILSKLTAMIGNNGREAMATVKRMIASAGTMDEPQWRIYMAETVAALRSGDECQEGISAFFEKRSPAWREKND